ncbi:hypothetical protein OAG85_02805 [Verrucomicrobiales bacterium]|nr:hypothetical protein [Verrucomicrobiales bacterium]MDB4808839.1 hypothetical protein [Verrucomicrobiales bacterium]
MDRVKRLQLGEADFDVHALHALQWLAYGHLQKGNYGQAFELLETMANIHRRRPTPMCKWYFALMRAAHVINAPDWKKANMEIDMDGVELSAAASDLFARGLAAIRAGTTGGERAMQQIVTLRTAAEKNIKDHSHHHSSYFDGVYPTSIRAARIMETQLEALILLADGRREQAVKRMKDAVAAEERLPVGYGPPIPVKPSRELLGETLLNLGQPKEAQAHFEASLARTPRRTLSLIGLAAAARDSNDPSVLEQTAKELRQILQDPQRGYPAWRDLPRGKNAGN